jgi:hypothetical protein
MQNILNEMEYELKSEIIKNRASQFGAKGFKSIDIEEKIFKPPVLTSDEALAVG